jgi:membrane protein YdbS with pleckstrin-like domain
MVQKQLHPGAKWLFFFRGIFSSIFLAFFLSIFLSSLFISLIINGVNITLILTIILIFLAVIIVLAFIYSRLAYKFWKYEFTDEQLRIERGIIWKRYSNIPYQRIQNVDINRGVIARICGFSSVNIQTAGYSMPAGRGYGRVSEGYIPAVSAQEAEKIREFVIKKITKRKGSGL